MALFSRSTRPENEGNVGSHGVKMCGSRSICREFWDVVGLFAKFSGG